MFTPLTSVRRACALAAALVLAACGNPPAPQDGFEPLKGADAVRTLESHRWLLDAAIDASGRRIDALLAPAPPSSRGFSLAFEGGMVIVGGSCNTMRGSYAVDADGRLAIGRMAATMKACEPAFMQADAALAKLLAEPLRAGIAKGATPKLRLATPAKDVLTFAGESTPEARYGPSTLAFLEVAAGRVPCGTPQAGAAACLQVRDRYFDQQGLPAGAPGEWRAIPDAIERYTHREGERTVLRVKRFLSAAASPYVLDLVVETEIAKP